MEALETALTETKLSLLRERENFQMYLAEQETRVVHNYRAAGAVDALAGECGEKLIIRNVSEARATIK